MSINETGFDYLCKICRFSLDDNFDSFLLLLLFLFWQIYLQSLCQSIKTKIVQANVHLAKHKKLIVTNYQANETISFQKSDKEYLSDAGDFLEDFSILLYRSVGSPVAGKKDRRGK